MKLDRIDNLDAESYEQCCAELIEKVRPTSRHIVYSITRPATITETWTESSEMFFVDFF